MADVAAIDDVLQESLQRARKLLLDAPGAEVLTLLKTADRRLKKRLVGITAGKPGLRFSEAQALMFSQQIAVAIDYVKQRLLGVTHEKANDAIAGAVRSTSRELAQLNESFTGISAPLRLREAGTMDGIVRRTTDKLLMQHAPSVDRYGEGMIRDFRKTMRAGMLQGVSQSQMVDALVGHGGPRGPKVSVAARVDPVSGKVVRLREEDIPEGLFVRKRYWAERVVRTEVAHGQNEARLQTIEESKEDFPDMGKKILAMMDNRTAMDSIGVHGQIRPTDGLFMDGAGRQYLRPPARPNDRETIVPWRLSWEETPYSAPMPPEEVAKLQHANHSPGLAKQAAIRTAKKARDAELDRSAKAAMAKIRARAKSARKAQPARRVLALKQNQATAHAQARVAKERARVALDKAKAKSMAQAQKYGTAEESARAEQVRRARDARATIAARQKRLRADRKVRRADARLG